MSNSDRELERRRIVFKNIAPESEEWTAHINMINKFTDPDMYLRHILQYARSGEFFPADMHVDLIRQHEAALLSRVGKEVIGTTTDATALLGNTDVAFAMNRLREGQRAKLDNIAKEIRGDKTTDINEGLDFRDPKYND